MTTRSETRYFIVCDTCGNEHHDPTSQSVVEGRIKAGIDGWKYRSGAAGRRGKGARKVADACPTCDLRPE